MGNIEAEQPVRRKKIFELKGKENREVWTPKFDTVKNMKTIQNKTVQTDHMETYRNGRSKARSINKKGQKDRNNIQDFDGFMVQVKKQLHEHSIQHDHEDTYEQEYNELPKRESKNSLVFNLKLENERLQLQRYKKMVERQLSKSHSIQKISIQGGMGQRKLVIHYDQLVNVKEIGLGNQRQGLQQRIEEERRKYRDGLQRAEKVFYSLSSNMQTIQALLSRLQPGGNIQCDKQFTIPVQKSENREPKDLCSSRLNRISGMFKDIDQLCTQQENIESEIRQTLDLNQFNSASSCQATPPFPPTSQL